MRSKDKMHNKKVSVIVPVYNMESSIENCVNSLIKQTHTNYEVILVDDGSKDDSLARCRSFERKNSNVIVYHTDNYGSGPARNYGIAHATGDYAYFPDADDYLEPDALAILVQMMERESSDLIVFGYKSADAKGKTISIKSYEAVSKDASLARRDYYDYYAMNKPFSIQGAPWNKFFRLDIIKNYNIEYPALRRHQDEVFIARYVSYIQKITYVNRILYTYYVNNLSREWDKYPKDYIDTVIGLFEDRKKNILAWNPEDKRMRDVIYSEYMCNVIKAIELSFSPQYGFRSKSERQKWINFLIKKSQISQLKIPECLPKYQRVILKFIEKENSLYEIIQFKVFVEKHGLISIIR